MCIETFIGIFILNGVPMAQVKAHKGAAGIELPNIEIFLNHLLGVGSTWFNSGAWPWIFFHEKRYAIKEKNRTIILHFSYFLVATFMNKLWVLIHQKGALLPPLLFVSSVVRKQHTKWWLNKGKPLKWPSFFLSYTRTQSREKLSKWASAELVCCPAPGSVL